MKKKMALFMALTVLIVFPVGAFLIGRECFSLTISRERERALNEEAAIARAVATEFSGKSKKEVFSAAFDIQRKYSSDAAAVVLLYNNRPMAGADLPEADNIDALISSEGRATLLDSETQTLFISHRLTNELSVLVYSSVAPVYALKDSLLRFSAAVSAVGAVVSASVAGIVSGAVLRPLSSLTRAAEKMEKGEYTFPLPEIRKDETGVLTSAFRNMQEAV